MIFRRYKFIVNARLQMKITLVFVIVSLAGSVAATAVFNYFALKELEKIMWSTHISLKDTGEIIGPLYVYINVIDFLFVFILLIIASMWITKKTSGPLFRMSKDIMKVANGDLSVMLKLRSKDEFRDTASELNRMIAGMRDRFKSLNEKHVNVSQSIAKLNNEINAPQKMKTSISAVFSNIRDLQEELKKLEIN